MNRRLQLIIFGVGIVTAGFVACGGNDKNGGSSPTGTGTATTSVGGTSATVSSSTSSGSGVTNGTSTSGTTTTSAATSTSAGGTTTTATSGGGSGGDGSGGDGSGGDGSGGDGSGGGNTGGTGGTGEGGEGGQAGAPAEPCGGCAVLTVPLSEADTSNYFTITLNQDVDLEDRTVTARVRVRQAGDGGFQLVVQDGTFQGLYPWTNIGDLDDGEWHDVAVDIVSNDTFDGTATRQFALVIAAGSSGSWETTILEVDSVTVTGNRVGPWNFDDGAYPLLSNDAISGSTIGWIE